ncbi:pentatricopeptide repeat-containing protein At5g03800 [Andrographis paniculata]|uniref:pentatricopeptide repeat-containing protein At5g03800 n=1 Tax=Andrographis paniculata TaxID=175694 RepID=UPI0021E84173|nr:pentatricopeptide repeat-containing protein At5g03800 [Andrographis paniculata]
MAALIHHCHNSATATASAHSRRPLKSFATSHSISSLSHSKPSPPLSSPKTLHLPNPSTPLSKAPSPHNEASPPRTNRDFSEFLQLSTDCSDVRLNKAIHASILKIQPDIRLFNSLITSYIRLDNLNYAERVFSSILSPDVVSYTAMISGLAKSGREDEAVELFFQMRNLGIEPNGYTFVALLTACVRLLDFEFGSQIHAFTVKTGFVDCTFVANSLMAFYGNCNSLDCVVNLFDEMPERDIASWNTVISFMNKEGLYRRVLELFHDLLVEEEDSMFDYFTLSSLLVACTKCYAEKEGSAIHAYAHKSGYGSHLSVANALIEFYAKCGNVEDVEALFGRMPMRDVFSWTEMISAYMGFGHVDSAVEVFNRMPEKNCVSYDALLSGFCRNREGLTVLRLFNRLVRAGVELTDVTLTTVLHACGITRRKCASEQIHAFVLKIDFGRNECIESALLDMCTRCNRMGDAERIFDRLPISPVTVTTMICGYARNAELDKAVSLICDLQYTEIDEVALASILGVCGDLGFQKLGEQLHSFAIKRGLFAAVGVGNGVISMYSKCGGVEEATKTFESMAAHDVVSWNSLLAGHIVNRRGDDALTVWDKMRKRRVEPNTITCGLILSAYRHTSAESVNSCRDFFLSMKPVYRIDPSSDHFAGFVSVLGFWGFLEEAEEVIEKMPVEPTAAVWRALLNSCRIHKKAEIGRRAAKEILSVEPRDPSTYILQSNLYSASGRWHCSDNVRAEMKSRGFRKFPVRSWIIDRDKVQTFYARDKSHPRSRDIYGALDVLFLECLKAGYRPDTSFVLHEVEEHQKPNFLRYHSAKLAVTYGLLTAVTATTTTTTTAAIRVMKNVHLCGDCHTFFKYVSIVTRRVIEVRDASGFHCFARGECSCMDQW